MKVLKKIPAVIVILGGIAATVFWIIKDPGFSVVFKRSTVIIGFIPIPGKLFGYLVQIMPAIAGIVIGGNIWMK